MVLWFKNKINFKSIASDLSSFFRGFIFLFKYLIYPIFFFSLSIFFLASPVKGQTNDPQYIFVRKNPMHCVPEDCSQLWNMNNPNIVFSKGIDDIYNTIGTRGNDQRKLGIGVIINYFEYDFNNIKQSLSNLLIASREKKAPLFLVLEGFAWWDKRPDLWNWWDPSIPGFNPLNKNNVEWTCWDSSCAIKKSWRNWGDEMEVRPQPNLASRAYIEAIKSALRELIPLIVNWYNGLPPDEKWLFGGISLGGEVDIGGNYYYYPNGVPNGKGLSGSVQLGYAAVKTLGIKSSGNITSDDINKVVNSYLTELNKLAYDLGIPRNKIFNHTGGKGLAPFIEYPRGVAFETPYATLNEYAFPGWSFYGDVTSNPGKYDVKGVLDQIGANQWAVPEWLTFAENSKGWLDSLRGTLNYRNNRFLNISNWEEIKVNPNAVSAIKQVLQERPSCWVSAPYVDISVSGKVVTLRWTSGSQNLATYLNISNVPEFTFGGTLKNINVHNENVTGRNEFSKTLDNGSYYFELVVDGCPDSSGRATQRKFVDGRFTIGPVKNDSDLNGDGKVDIFDYNILMSDFGKTGVAGFTKSDINKDGKVDIFDYNILISDFGK